MATKSPGHLLIVDDNLAIRKLIAAHFSELHYEVTEAGSAVEAKAELLKRNFVFDLVLSDISMPGESGFDLLQWIKANAEKPEDLPVLLMTGVLPDVASRLKGLSLGAVDYVVRPDDISELVIRSINAIEHYKRVRSLERSLEDSQDLAMVGRILAAANHEIKNVAAILKLSADQAVGFLRGEDENSVEIKRHVASNLQMSSDLLVDIVRNFRSLLGENGHANKKVALSSVVNETLQLMSFRTKSVFIVWNGGIPDCWVHGQPTRIKQVLINMILNGLDAISELGPPEGGRIEVAVLDDGQHWTVRVKDNGIGFAAGTKSSFVAFDTTRKLKGGTGLGLWLSSMIAQSMQGTVTLSSGGGGQGATAELRLPKHISATDDFSIDIEKYLSENS